MEEAMGRRSKSQLGFHSENKHFRATSLTKEECRPKLQKRTCKAGKVVWSWGQVSKM